jgi:hypothetical protein
MSLTGSFSGSLTLVPEGPTTLQPSTWHVGQGTPQDTFGNNGDLYLDKTTGDVYLKENNTWA